MFKKIIFIISAIIILLTILFFLSPPKNLKDDLKIGIFKETGYLTHYENEKDEFGLFLIYESPGKPALTKKIILGNDSLCETFSGDFLPCFDLERTVLEFYDNQKVEILGKETKNGTVAVQKISKREDKINIWRFGFIKDIRDNNQNFLLEIDEVEFLSGEEAIGAGILDTDCNRENIYDCIPSLNNDFYIRNSNKELKIYILDKETSVSVFKNPGSPVLEKISAENLMGQFLDSSRFIKAYPFKFKLDGAIIFELEEVYTP